jgi:hypothetical protein
MSSLSNNPVIRSFHSTCTPVSAITPTRENYHCLLLLEADNGERNHAF